MRHPAFTGQLSRGLMVLAAFWAFFLAIIITVDVTGRGLFDRPLTGVVEIIANSIVVMVFFQAGEVVRSGSMLRADFLVANLGSGAAKVLDTICYVAGAMIFLLIAYGCLGPMLRAFERNEFEGMALRIATWPIYAAIIFGSCFAAFNYLLLLICLWRQAPDASSQS